MPDLFIVRTRPDGWEIVRKPDGSAQRIVIARGLTRWPDVLRHMDEAAAQMGGFAWPEERTLEHDVFSLRTEPEQPLNPSN